MANDHWWKDPWSLFRRYPIRTVIFVVAACAAAVQFGGLNDSISAVAAVLAVFLVVLWRQPTLPGYWNDDAAAARVNASRYPKPNEVKGELLPREALVGELNRRLESDNGKTILLYGKRGAGKTTLLWLALQTEPSTVLVMINQDTDDHYKKLWFALAGADAQLPPGTEPEKLAIDLLRRIKERGDPKPIIVFDLAHSVSGAKLDVIIEQCKRMGSDRGLARFIVEASSARAAHEVGRELHTYRVDGFIVGDLSRDETTSRASNLLRAAKNLVLEEAEVTEIAERIADQIGGNVLDLRRFFDEDLASPPPPPNVDWVREERVKARWKTDVRDALGNLEKMMSNSADISRFAEDSSPRQRLKEILAAQDVKDALLGLASSSMETMLMDALAKILSFGSRRVQEQHLVTINAKLGPHPFFLNPFDKTARLSSAAYREAAVQLYQPPEAK